MPGTMLSTLCVLFSVLHVLFNPNNALRQVIIHICG